MLPQVKLCFRIPSEELKPPPSTITDFITKGFRIPSEELKQIDCAYVMGDDFVLEYLVRN